MINLFISIIMASVTPVLHSGRYSHTEPLDNATTWIVTATHDGSGQATHPSIVSSGTTYWMAMTPYPYSNANLEVPNILSSASPDQNYTVPTMITNPIGWDPVGVTEHLADTEIVASSGSLYMYYISTSATEAVVIFTSATDLSDWPTTHVIVETNTYPDNDASPAVLYEDGTWHYWAMHENAPHNIIYRSMTDEKTVGSRQNCTFSPTPSANKDTIPWHIDVVYDTINSEYIMMFCSIGNDITSNSIHMATSEDKLNWTLYEDAVMLPSGTGWDGSFLYRPSMLLDSGKLHILYGAGDDSLQWQIGYRCISMESLKSQMRHEAVYVK